jgi:hypothetical protein
MLVGGMESAETIQISDEVMCLIDLQVEVLKGFCLRHDGSVKFRSMRKGATESANFVVKLEVPGLSLIPLVSEAVEAMVVALSINIGDGLEPTLNVL